MLKSIARHLAGVSCVAVLFFAFALPALAQTRVYSDEYLQHINAAKSVGALGDNLFGDSINEYTGSVEFSNVDVSLPGNDGLPVSVGRHYGVEDKTNQGVLIADGLFGDWELDIPHLHGIYSSLHEMTRSTADRRCNAADALDAQVPVIGDFQPDEYHRGNHLHLPGAGDQEVMWFTGGSDKPTDGLTYKWVTKGRWYFSCLTSTDNPTAVPGDAFLARAPDGSKIWFDHVVQRWHPGMSKPYGGAALMAAPEQSAAMSASTVEADSLASDSNSSAAVAPGTQLEVMRRNEVWILPSRVEDRFGNWVKYTYDAVNPWQLTKIESSDLRTIILAYSNGRVATVFDGTRTWTYGYNATTGSLTSVTLPDTSQWVIDFASLNGNYFPVGGIKTYCRHPGSLSTGSPTGTITHPSGAQGVFTFAQLWHGRQYTWQMCFDYREYPQSLEPYYSTDLFPAFFQARSVVSKQISGSGMATRNWNWSYPTLSYSYESDCASGCVATKVITVTQPDASKRRQTYGTHYGVDEGLLLKSEVLTSAGAVLSTTTNDYVTTGTGQTYPATLGASVQDQPDPDAAYFKPTFRRQTVQDGVTFAWQVGTTGAVYNFDKYTNPLTETRSSTGGAGGNFSRNVTAAYYHDTAKWVLSQAASVTDVATGKVMHSTTYNPSTDLPATNSSFGVLQQSFVYNADGTLASVKDGLNHSIGLSSWYRGVPRTISFPTSVTQTAVVNRIGTLASTTDELGYSHSYGYDAIGRLASITYPTADTTNWNGLGRSFVSVTASEYGIGAGHWKQTVSTGNGRATTYYDPQWRPLLVLTEDTGNASSKSFVVHRYDAAGREVFVSYPVGSLTSVNDTLTGVNTVYDALGRLTQAKQDSELGLLTTTTEYLTGFQTRVTNPRGYKTTTSYQLFDSPSTAAPVNIISGVGLPEQQTTTIVRDGFGKPLSITRSGAGG